MIYLTNDYKVKKNASISCAKVWRTFKKENIKRRILIQLSSISGASELASGYLSSRSLFEQDGMFSTFRENTFGGILYVKEDRSALEISKLTNNFYLGLLIFIQKIHYKILWINMYLIYYFLYLLRFILKYHFSLNNAEEKPLR